MLSILIPTYNRAEFLARLLSAIKKSNCGLLKVIISDNNSEDLTPDVVSYFSREPLRIDYYRQKHNIGSFENFKFLFSLVDTEYFLVISDDDFLLPGMIDRAVNNLNKSASIDFVVQRNIWINKSGQLLADQSESFPDGREEPPSFVALQKFLDLRYPYIWSSYVFRRHLAQEFISLEYADNADFKFLYKVYAKYRCAYTPEVGVLFTSHEASYSSTLPRFSLGRFLSDQRLLMELRYDNDHPEINHATIKTPSLTSYIIRSYRNYFGLFLRSVIKIDDYSIGQFRLWHRDLLLSGFPVFSRWMIESHFTSWILKIIFFSYLKKRHIKHLHNIRIKRSYYLTHLKSYARACEQARFILRDIASKRGL